MLGIYPIVVIEKGKTLGIGIQESWKKKVVVNGIISDIKNEIIKRKDLKLPPPLCIVLVSGHGGNNYLSEEQEKIGHAANVPVLYLPPFSQISLKHKKFGRVGDDSC